MARQAIWTILGLLCVQAGAQVHTDEGEAANALEGNDIVRLKDPALGLEIELGDMGKGEGKLVMGRNVTFDISGFSVEREVEDLVAREEHKKEEGEENHGVINTNEEDWIEETFIEGVKRFVLGNLLAVIG